MITTAAAASTVNNHAFRPFSRLRMLYLWTMTMMITTSMMALGFALDSFLMARDAGRLIERLEARAAEVAPTLDVEAAPVDAPAHNGCFSLNMQPMPHLTTNGEGALTIPASGTLQLTNTTNAVCTLDSCALFTPRLHLP